MFELLFLHLLQTKYSMNYYSNLFVWFHFLLFKVTLVSVSSLGLGLGLHVLVDKKAALVFQVSPVSYYKSIVFLLNFNKE